MMSSEFDEVGAPTPNRRDKARDDAEALERYIQMQIASGAWRPGQRLPSDRKLQGMFGMARHNIRKTIDIFVAHGLIERHVGSGTFLTEKSAEPSAGDQRAPFVVFDAGPADVIELRILFEPAVVALAVARSTNSGIERMERYLEKGAEAPDWRGFEHWDAELHLAIAESTRNPAIIQMHHALSHVRNLGEWTEIKARSLTDERRAQLQEEHSQIVRAIRARSPTEAQMRMREHLEHVQFYMFRPG